MKSYGFHFKIFPPLAAFFMHFLVQIAQICNRKAVIFWKHTILTNGKSCDIMVLPMRKAGSSEAKGAFLKIGKIKEEIPKRVTARAIHLFHRADR